MADEVEVVLADVGLERRQHRDGEALDFRTLGTSRHRGITGRRTHEVDALAVGDVEGDVEIQLLGRIEGAVEGVAGISGVVAVDVLRPVGTCTRTVIVGAAHRNGVEGALLVPFHVVIASLEPIAATYAEVGRD